MKYTQFEGQGYHTHIIETKKFKTVSVSVKLYTYHRKEDRALRGLLPHVLCARTMAWQSKKTLSQMLEAMYGASLGANVSRNGRLSVITFTLRILNHRYIETSTDLVEKAIDMIHTVIFRPNMTTLGFDDDVVQEEKRLAIDDILSLRDNKTRFALKRLIEVMCANEDYGITTLDDPNEIEKVTPQMLNQYYHNVIQKENIDIIVVGDVETQNVKQILDSKFQRPGTPTELTITDLEDKVGFKTNDVEEVDDIRQAKLNIGYRVKTRVDDEDYAAMTLFNHMFGGYAGSLLFLHVREEASLCYYIASRYDGYKGIMYVYAGIDANQKEKALQLIQASLDQLITGDFETTLIDSARKALINDILESHDSQGVLSEKAFISKLLHRDYDLNRMIVELNKVDHNDIMRVAKYVTLDTIYMLKKGDDLDEEIR